MNRTRTRIPVIAAIAAAVLTGAQAGGAAAQSGESDGLPADVRAVAAIAPVRTDNGGRALDVYRALIPRGLEMPSEPAVGVWLAELASGRALDGRPQDEASHWIEGAIQIRVRRGAEDGWLNIHYPVTAEFWFQAGRMVGLPKRHAEASITENGAGWTAQATPTGVGGGPAILMDWKPAPGGDPAALRRAYRIAQDPFFTLNPPLEGPELMRFKDELRPPTPAQLLVPGGPPPYSSGASPQGGTVRLRLRPKVDDYNEDLPDIFPRGASLADLMDTDQVVPGTHAFFALTVNSESRTIGTGGYPGKAGSAGPAGGPLRLKLGCWRGRGKAVLSGSQVGQVRRVAFYVNGRRAARDGERPFKRRIGRRRFGKARKWRVRARARMSDGRIRKVRRTRKPCRRG